MRRKAVALGVLGLICAAALPKSAEAQQIKIFGQNYAVVSQTAVNLFGQRYFYNGFGPVTRAQTYKNGVTINLDDGTAGVNNFASVYFSQGATIAQDRLWFAARIAPTPGVGDQVYYLEGSDANGMFTPSVSTATTFFGGKADANRGGRPIFVIELNRDNLGVKQDRNVLLVTFQDADSYRVYDTDTMKTDRVADAILSRTLRNDAGTASDAGPFASANFPYGNFPSFAPLPTPDGHTIVVVGSPGQTLETSISIWDTKTDDAFPVLTDITAQTRSASKPFPLTDSGNNNLTTFSVARYGDQGEYWFLLDNPSPGGSSNAERTGIVLVRARLEIPANLATAKAGDIKMTVLETQDLKATASDILFPAGTAGITGLAAGRTVGATGPRVLYTTDYNGNFYTLIPVP
jgi:hypothetical protein